MLCYDIDIELKECAADRSFQLERIAMLTHSPTPVDTRVSVPEAHETSLCLIS